MPTRTRQYVTMPDGVERAQTKPPRVDVLHYPVTGWTTLLVRFTHDPVLARELAESRWAELADLHGGVPLADGHRAGWWTTGHGGEPRRDDAVDPDDRVVRWAPDPYAVHAAGPAVEIRPVARVADPTR